MPEISENTQGIRDLFKKNKFLIPALIIGAVVGLFFLLRNGNQSVDTTGTILPETPGGLDDGSGQDLSSLEQLLTDIFNQNAENQTIMDEKFQSFIDSQDMLRNDLSSAFSDLAGSFNMGAIPGDYGYSPSGGSYATPYNEYGDVALQDYQEEPMLGSIQNPLNLRIGSSLGASESKVSKAGAGTIIRTIKGPSFTPTKPVKPIPVFDRIGSKPTPKSGGTAFKTGPTIIGKPPVTKPRIETVTKKNTVTTPTKKVGIKGK